MCLQILFVHLLLFGCSFFSFSRTVSGNLFGMRHFGGFALGPHLHAFQYEHNALDLNEKFGIFITINPVCHFGNEQKHTIGIPAILKSYYRPIALAEHDNEFICFVMLLSDGFSHARVCDSFHLIHILFDFWSILYTRTHYNTQ